MRTWAVVNLKGGVGKTTAAVMLATVWAADRRVHLIDLDPEGHAAAWAHTAAASGDPLPFEVTRATVRTLPAALAATVAADTVVIDTEPRLSPATTAALAAADRVIVPVGASWAEVHAVPRTLAAAADTATPAVVALTRCPRGTRDVTDALGALGEMGATVAAAQVADVAAVRRAAGECPGAEAVARWAALAAELDRPTTKKGRRR